MYPYFHIGSLMISTYFLVISLASTIGAIWFLRRTEGKDLSKVVAIDLTLICLLSGFAGARLLHVFYEDPTYYRADPRLILEIWNGGFVFLGGLMGATLGGYVFCRLRKLPFLYMLDLAIIPLSFSYAVGRLACFLNGCCYGRKCELPWAIILNGEPRHPSQLYASFWEFTVLAILIRVEPRLKTAGKLFGFWLVLHSLGRIVMEAFRDDPRGEMIIGQSLGTWLSIVMFCLGLGLVWPKPGPENAQIE